MDLLNTGARSVLEDPHGADDRSKGNSNGGCSKPFNVHRIGRILGYLRLDGALPNPDCEPLCVSIVNTDVFRLAMPSKLAKINQLFSTIDMSR
jgi:hypothetical protein